MFVLKSDKREIDDVMREECDYLDVMKYTYTFVSEHFWKENHYLDDRLYYDPDFGDALFELLDQTFIEEEIECVWISAEDVDKYLSNMLNEMGIKLKFVNLDDYDGGWYIPDEDNETD